MSDRHLVAAASGTLLADAVAARDGCAPDEAWLLALLEDLSAELAARHAQGRLHLAISPISVMTEAGRWRLIDGCAPDARFAAPATETRGPWSDLYALAALVRWALTGSAPQPAEARLHHDDEGPLSRLPQARCSARFAAAIDHAFRLDAEARTRDVAQFLAELGLPLPTATVQQAQPPLKPPPDRDEDLAALALPPRPAPQNAPVPMQPPTRAAAGLGGLLGRVLAAPGAALKGLLRRREPAAAAPAAAEAAAAAGPATVAEAPPPEALHFGLSAPRRALPGSDVALVFMAYVESARAATLAQVQAMAGETHRQLMDLQPDDPRALWQPGTPFTVKVTGRAFEVEPAELTFKWNGTRHILNFALHVKPGASGPALVSVLVSVEGVAVASFSVPVEIGGGAAADAPAGEVAAPRSVFASYASKDAVEVAARLSTLTRWAPALDIFQDCLDLKPGEAFKPQLAGQIAGRDAFLLFWSRHAAASSWVRWEIGTALASKPPQAILPMPLEDPALAPPPPELAALHFRDRFLLAGYAARGIEAARTENPAATPPGAAR